MGAPPTTAGRPRPTTRQRVLVLLAVAAALAAGAALVVGFSSEFDSAGFAVYHALVAGVCALPLLARSARGLRIWAAVLGVLMLLWSLLTALIGGILLAPTGLLLLVAAIVPPGRPPAPS